MIIGDNITSYDAGEVWHLFDQRYEIPLTNVTAVISRQGIIGRLAGYGTLSIEHSDNKMSVYEMLPKPELIKRELSQLMQ